MLFWWCDFFSFSSSNRFTIYPNYHLHFPTLYSHRALTFAPTLILLCFAYHSHYIHWKCVFMTTQNRIGLHLALVDRCMKLKQNKTNRIISFLQCWKKGAKKCGHWTMNIQEKDGGGSAFSSWVGWSNHLHAWNSFEFGWAECRYTQLTFNMHRMRTFELLSVRKTCAYFTCAFFQHRIFCPHLCRHQAAECSFWAYMIVSRATDFNNLVDFKLFVNTDIDRWNIMERDERRTKVRLTIVHIVFDRLRDGFVQERKKKKCFPITVPSSPLRKFHAHNIARHQATEQHKNDDKKKTSQRA